MPKSCCIRCSLSVVELLVQAQVEPARAVQHLLGRGLDAGPHEGLVEVVEAQGGVDLGVHPPDVSQGAG